MSNIPVKVTVGLVDEISQKLDKIKNKFPEVQDAVKRVRNNFDFVQESTKGFRQQVESISKTIGPKMQSIGKAMTYGITLPVVAGTGYSIKKFMDFENALTEVRGSTELTGQELTDFGQKMQKAATETTFSQDELLGLANAAGEAGVRGSSNLEKFTLVLAKLQKTANIAGPEAAMTIKKVLELTKDGVGSVSNFGSALTALENKYGANAKRVLESTLAITREIGKFGLSSSQTTALAAAIEPLGFEARQASMAVGEAFRGIDDAIRNGGVKMQGLQKITGMTAEELKKNFKDKPEAVFQAFLNGLNKIESQGGQTTEALQFFGASGDKTGVILTTLAKDTGKLTEMMKFSGDEFAKNTALNDEYLETTGTLSASLKHLKNNTDALSTALGNRLAPFVKIAADALGGLLHWFNEHPTIATFVAVLAGLLAILGPIIWALGSFLVALPNILIGINLLTAAFAVFKVTVWAAIAPILLVLAKFILIAAAIGAIVYVIWKFRDAIKEGLVAAWDWVIEKIQKAIELLKEVTAFMSQGILKFTPIGGAAFLANKALNAISPEGPATNAAQSASAANKEFSTQTNNARVSVDFRGVPQGSVIRSESENGILSINRGMAGAF